jgi:anti-sigma B factor antagonist
MSYESSSSFRIVTSRLDAQGGAGLQQELSKVLLSTNESHNGDRICLLDMTEVEFIDSDGLFALLGILETASKRGIQLILCSVSPLARLVLDITQLDRVFTIQETPALP